MKIYISYEQRTSKRSEGKITRLKAELEAYRVTLNLCKEGNNVQYDVNKKILAELERERELRKELVNCIETYVDLELFANPKPIESLIEKAKN